MLSRILALVGLLAFSPAPLAWGQVLQASLVQKEMADAGPVSFETGLVQVAFPDGKVEVLPYRTHLTPLAAGGRVFIFPSRAGRLTGLVVYDAQTRQPRSFPLPSALLRKPATSPWGLLAPLVLGLLIDSYEVWAQYRDVGLLAEGHDPLWMIVPRHGQDVATLLAIPLLLAVAGMLSSR